VKLNFSTTGDFENLGRQVLLQSKFLYAGYALRSTFDTEFGVDVGCMALHGGQRDEEMNGDFLVCHSGDYQANDFDLSGAQ